MPVYDYACGSCGLTFERLEHVSEPSPRPCPACGAAAARQLGAPALQFKGSGWYVTEYGTGRSSASTTAGTTAGAAGPATRVRSAA